jgi:hypothetical protein
MTDFVTSHCITLILIGQTIKLLGKSKTQENWGLFVSEMTFRGLDIRDLEILGKGSWT